MRYDKTLNSKFMRGFQLYGFVDGGMVWAADTNNSASLASVGLGARFYLPGQLEAGLAVATPVASSQGLSEPRPVRVLFSLSNSFKLCPDKHQLRCS